MRLRVVRKRSSCGVAVQLVVRQVVERPAEGEDRDADRQEVQDEQFDAVAGRDRE